MPDPAPLAVLAPTLFRRVLAAGAVGGVGVLMLWIGFLQPPDVIGWQVFSILLGAGALWVAVQLWQATARYLVLTAEGLFDSDGQCLARTEDMAKIDRGVFAFKPSNGFTIVLKSPGPRGWAPGLWWRMGRRLGVGGVTPGPQGKYMAETLAMALAGGET